MVRFTILENGEELGVTYFNIEQNHPQLVVVTENISDTLENIMS